MTGEVPRKQIAISVSVSERADRPLTFGRQPVRPSLSARYYARRMLARQGVLLPFTRDATAREQHNAGTLRRSVIPARDALAGRGLGCGPESGRHEEDAEAAEG